MQDPDSEGSAGGPCASGPLAGRSAYLPYSPFSNDLGFKPLPVGFFFALGGMVVLYLSLVEFAKRRFFARIGVRRGTRLSAAFDWMF